MAILLGRRDKEPICCGVCGRQAGPNGHVAFNRKDIVWLCDDGECWTAATRIYKMPAKQLSRYEEIAITEGVKKSVDALLTSVLNEVWSAGVRNLDDLDGPKFAKIASAFAESADTQQSIKSFLEGYGESVKAQVCAGDPPF